MKKEKLPTKSQIEAAYRRLVEIKEKKEEASRTQSEIKKIYKSLILMERKLGKRAESAESKEDKFLTKSQETYDKIVNRLKEAKKLVKGVMQEADNELDAIGANKEKSDTATHEVVSILNEARESRQEIEKLYSFVNDTSQTIGFDREVKEYSEEKQSVGKKLFWAIAALFFSVVAIFAYLVYKGASFENISVYPRFLITSPLVYLVYLLSERYSRVDQLVSKYRQKRAMSLTLPRHISQIKTELSGLNKDNELAEFVIDKYNVIYQEPFYDVREKVIMKYKIMKTKLEHANKRNEDKAVLGGFKIFGSKNRKIGPVPELNAEAKLQESEIPDENEPA